MGSLLSCGDPTESAPSEASIAETHPYLFFSPLDIQAIRNRCATSMKPQFDALLDYAREHVGDTPPSVLSGGYEAKGDALQHPFLTNILVFSFLYVVTGETRYRDAGKHWALTLAAMHEWVGDIRPEERRCGNCGYPEGWAATALAVAYDWLFPHFDAVEKALVRNKLSLLCAVLHGGALANEWWTRAYLHHDTWIPLGGLGIAAMAIIDEDPDAPKWAERAKIELDGALDWLDGDGAWPEGPSGFAFAMIAVLPFWDAFCRVFPSRASEILQNPWVKNAWKFEVYPRTPDGLFLGFGDSYLRGNYQWTAREAAPTMRFLAARYDNPYAQWVAAREWAKNPNPFTAVWEIIWMDPSIRQAPPDDLPHGVHFDNQEMVYLRTGWSESSTILAFRCDSVLGRRAASLYKGEDTWRWNNSTTHVHADANSFAIWSRGDFSVSMSQYGQKESSFQNTLLVDGEGQYRRFDPSHVGRPDGQITSYFSSRDAGFAVGDAARSYPPVLQKFIRRIYLTAPGFVFLVDEVAAERPVGLEWRFHTPQSTKLSIGADGFSTTLEGRTTVMRFAQPSGFRVSDYLDTWNHEISVVPPGKMETAALVAVVLPCLPDHARPAITTPSARSFIVDALGANVLAVFSMGSEDLGIPGRLAANGSAAIVSSYDDMKGLFVVESTRLSVDGQSLVAANSPLTLSYFGTQSAGHLTVSTPRATELTLAAGFRVQRVRSSDGREIAFSADGSRLTLAIPSGTTLYDIF